MPDELEQSRMLDACFQGQIDRDCENCVAHGDHGGRCCFGKKYDEYDEDDCQKCRHHDDCAEECGYVLEDDEEEDEEIRIGPKGDRLGPPIRPSIWDRLSESRKASPARITVKPRNTPQPSALARYINRPRPSAGAGTTVVAKEPDWIPMDDRIPIGEEDPNPTAAKRFLKDTVWGGGEGFFRAGLDFFRNHRLR